MNNSESVLKGIFLQAGVKIGGTEPWDITVHDSRFYDKVFVQGSLGLGESYMDSWWDCPRVDEMLARIIRAELDKHEKITPELVLLNLKARLFNTQNPKNAYENISHYDLGNELFERMLGPSMAYSCGYWRQASDLDQAQENKFELICKKLQLGPGQRVLDIGCGFGTLAKYAAEKYQCSVTGITLARQQLDYAQRLCAGTSCEFLLYDYRDPRLHQLPKFDKIVSVGMFEHVGLKNYRSYMKIVASLLKEDGLFLLHTIGNNITKRIGDQFLTTYFYPNGMLPSPAAIADAAEGVFVIEDWHNFGADYDKTLMSWLANFQRYAASPGFPYDQHFIRKWNYYLQLLAGSFRARTKTQLWQIVLSHKGIRGGYPSIR